MPFGGWFDNYYEDIYYPAIEAGNLKPTRADDLYRPGTIINDIWKFTQDAKIVLADLTGKSANVFYELGLAHALAKPAILVTQSVDDIPFDLRTLRVLEYDKNHSNWGERLKNNITEAIVEVINSPLESVLPTFLQVNRTLKPKILSEQEKSILEIKTELSNLRREMLSKLNRSSETPIPPYQAEKLIMQYLDENMPERIIIRRLERKGVPESWIRRRIEKYSNKILFEIDENEEKLE